MLEFLHEKLQEYDRIILVTHLSPQEEWGRILDKLTVLGNKTANTICFFVETGIECPERVPYIVLSHESTQDLYQLYLTYEFSNRFSVLSGNLQYGTIFNFANSGILTEEEVVMAFLS